MATIWECLDKETQEKLRELMPEDWEPPEEEKEAVENKTTKGLTK